MKREIWHTAIYRCSKSSFNREVYGNTGLPQELRKISNNLTLYLKELRTNKPKVSRRKEIVKIAMETNELEIKETIEKISGTQSWFFENINKTGKLLGRLNKKKREEEFK